MCGERKPRSTFSTRSVRPSSRVTAPARVLTATAGPRLLTATFWGSGGRVTRLTIRPVVRSTATSWFWLSAVTSATGSPPRPAARAERARKSAARRTTTLMPLLRTSGRWKSRGAAPAAEGEDTAGVELPCDRGHRLHALYRSRADTEPDEYPLVGGAPRGDEPASIRRPGQVVEGARAPEEGTRREPGVLGMDEQDRRLAGRRDAGDGRRAERREGERVRPAAERDGREAA